MLCHKDGTARPCRSKTIDSVHKLSHKGQEREVICCLSCVSTTRRTLTDFGSLFVLWVATRSAAVTACCYAAALTRLAQEQWHVACCSALQPVHDCVNANNANVAMLAGLPNCQVVCKTHQGGRAAAVLAAAPVVYCSWHTKQAV